MNCPKCGSNDFDAGRCPDCNTGDGINYCVHCGAPLVRLGLCYGCDKQSLIEFYPNKPNVLIDHRCKDCANILYDYQGLMNFNRDAGCMDCVETGSGRSHFKDREQLEYRGRVKTLLRVGLVSAPDIGVLHSCGRISVNDARYVLDMPEITESDILEAHFDVLAKEQRGDTPIKGLYEDQPPKEKLKFPRERCEHFGTVNADDCSECPEDLNLACIDVAAMMEERVCPGCSDHNLRMWAIQSKENQILKRILRENRIDYLNWRPGEQDRKEIEEE